MLKEKIKGGLFVIIIELIIGIAAGVYIHLNYLNITKEVSKVEPINLKTFSGSGYQDAFTGSSFLTTGNNIKYNGVFGKILIKHIVTGSNSFSYKDVNSLLINIDIQKYRKYKYFKYLLDNGIIDIFIYDYFIDKDINDFYYFYKNISGVSHYLINQIHLIDISVVNEDINRLSKLIENKEYTSVINELINFENELKIIYSNKDYKNEIIKCHFFDDEEFNYLINRFVIDKENYYSGTVNQTANIFKISPNLIRSAILTEQVRSFYTYRGFVKDIIKTNRLLVVMSKFSYGIGGIKLETAAEIEKQLAQSYPDIYKKYFDYAQDGALDAVGGVRYNALTKDTFMQIMYVGGLLRNILDRWNQQGINISNNIGVVMTLYNFGNASDKQPHENPAIGGAVLSIKNKDYSFGALGMILYYYLEIYVQTDK